MLYLLILRAGEATALELVGLSLTNEKGVRNFTAAMKTLHTALSFHADEQRRNDIMLTPACEINPIEAEKLNFDCFGLRLSGRICPNFIKP